MKTTTTPPEIIGFFDRALLMHPLKLGDDLEVIWQVWEYIEEKLIKKADRYPKKKERFERLKKEFLEIYERTKKKEEDPQAKTGNKTKRPMYYIRIPNKGASNVWRGLRSKRNRTPSKTVNNNAA